MSNPGMELKDLLIQVTYIVSVTKQSNVKMLITERIIIVDVKIMNVIYIWKI
jgi:hypothetical protein